MRLLSVRLIVSLILGITLVSAGFSYYEVLGEKRALRGALERSAEVLGESLVGNVEQFWTAGPVGVSSQVADNSAHNGPNSVRKNVPDDISVPNNVPNSELQRLVQRFGNREHLLGVAIYD